MHKNYHLDVAPTEFSPSFDEKQSYTVRLPFDTLLKSSPDFLNSLLDTANVAFGHNEPGKKDIYVSVPIGYAGELKHLEDFFTQQGMKVTFNESEAGDFAKISVIKNLEWTCVDRRLDDKGANDTGETADGQLGQITHPASILFLHKEVAKNLPPHHRKYLREIIRQVNENRWKIKELVLHAGIDGAAGCGGVGVARRAGAKIETIEDHVRMVREIRDSYKDAMDQECRITAQLVDPDNNVTTLDTDDAGECKELFKTKLNV